MATIDGGTGAEARTEAARSLVDRVVVSRTGVSPVARVVVVVAAVVVMVVVDHRATSQVADPCGACISPPLRNSAWAGHKNDAFT